MRMDGRSRMDFDNHMALWKQWGRQIQQTLSRPELCLLSGRESTCRK